MNKPTPNKQTDIRRAVIPYLYCNSCGDKSPALIMLGSCPRCSGALQYLFEGSFDEGGFNGRSDHLPGLWKYFDLLPLQHTDNIVSLGEGYSEVIELSELSDLLRGAKLFIKLDCEKNPTGTFKDREASLVISRCKELRLDNLVFYSTGNTGRAYTRYAAQIGLTTYFFMPKECQYKLTASIKKNENNFIILIDDDYRKIAPYAKQFAAVNGLIAIAPLHDRTESYATIAYEQFQQMPECDFFVQTIASGMGPVGFLRGHKNLVRFGFEKKEQIPRIICVQSRETNSMYRAYAAGKTVMTADDLPAVPPASLFEPTLNSTNPINNYPDLRQCLAESNGIIEDVEPKEVVKVSKPLVEALERRKIGLRFDLEKSLLIGFTGLVKVAEEGRLGRNVRVLLLGTGRGREGADDLVSPDAVAKPQLDDPKDLKQRLDRLL
jgi:threonine synthase